MRSWCTIVLCLSAYVLVVPAYIIEHKYKLIPGYSCGLTTEIKTRPPTDSDKIKSCYVYWTKLSRFSTQRNGTTQRKLALSINRTDKVLLTSTLMTTTAPPLTTTVVENTTTAPAVENTTITTAVEHTTAVTGRMDAMISNSSP